MAGKNPHEAVNNFLHPIQAVLACFSPVVLSHRGGYEVGRQHLLIFPDDVPIALRGGSRLEFHFSHKYEVVRSDDPERGPWKVKTLGYVYKLATAADSVEVLSYHWHPEGKWKQPHLHVGAQTALKDIDFKSAHLPTQRVSVEDVLELAVNSLGAEPLNNRQADWEETLDSTRRRFLRYKTW